jgi:phospholipid transport system substrate-binding protein
MSKLFFAIGLSLLICATAAASDQKTVEDLLRDRLDAVLAVLQNEDLDLESKKARISELVTPLFDFALMAKLTLGKKYWPEFTEAQQARFTELFIRLLKQTYLERVSMYSDERVVFNGTVQNGNKVHISTELVSKDSTIGVLYKFYKSTETWRIYDIEIEGVSLITTYRTQFDEALRKGTVEDLLLKLERPQTT